MASRLSPERREEMADEIEQVAQEIGNALNTLRQITRGTRFHNHAETYIYSHLDIMVEQGTYVSRDPTLFQLATQIREDT